MVNSQADRLVPGSNESILASARSRVSCTRSSARSTLPHSDMANARRLGTTARMASRTDGSRVTCGSLSPRSRFLAAALVDAVQQIDEAVRNALVHHVVIEGAELLADLGLDVAAEARVGLGGGLFGVHLRAGP